MKYKFCSIRINVTKYDITFATKEVLPHPFRVYTTGVKFACCFFDVAKFPLYT